MIRLKPNSIPPVSLDNVHPRIFMAIALAAQLWEQYGSPDLWITAANEKGHTTNPNPRRQFHFLPDGTCRATDLRTWTIPELEHRRQATKTLANLLGPLYDVIYEKPGQRGEHCHVQYDEERPGTRL